MGQNFSCSHCSPDSNEPFDPLPYVDTPSVTREDVLQLKVAFDYLSPKNGLVNLRTAQVKDADSVYMKEVLKEVEKDANEMTFDDLYRLMKHRIVEAKRRSGSQPAIMETSAVNASCIICPYAKRIEKSEKDHQAA